MSTLHRVNGAEGANRRIFVKLIRFPNAPDSGNSAPYRKCVERENRRKFREKKFAKNPSDKFTFRKGTFVCTPIGCKFVRLSIHRKPSFDTFVMLIFVFFLFSFNIYSQTSYTYRIQIGIYPRNRFRLLFLNSEPSIFLKINGISDSRFEIGLA